MFYENNVIYSFNEKNSPIESIESGETLIIEVNDTFNNQLIKSKDIENIFYEKVNPATGPFYIYQAIPNTMLKIKILDINLDNKGVGAVVEGLGVLGGKIHKSQVFEYQIMEKNIKLGDKNITTKPFISIVGVTPKERSYPCGIPYNHGGKMDCPHLKAGNTVYLPVHKQGGYLSLGGLKALQGFGQLGGTGIECSGEVKLIVEVTNKFFIDSPIVVTEKNIIFICSDTTFEIALERVSNEVTTFLAENLSLTFKEAYHYLSILGSLEIYQLVNPNVTIGISLPKDLINKTEINLFA